MRCCARIGVRLGGDERRDGFRADIEGLRGVAVLAVVVYHAGLGVVGGGFVGVDVFYVLSGFLITGLLWEELQRTGRLRFGEFYARRARRLLPAAVLVLVVTVAAASVWLSPLQARVVAQDAVAAAFYVANYRFAALRTDYLADVSPRRCSTTGRSGSRNSSTCCGRCWCWWCSWSGGAWELGRRWGPVRSWCWLGRGRLCCRCG